MKLVFIHGINNQQHLPSNVAARWWGQIRRGWQMANLTTLPQPETSVGYYAQRLYYATSNKTWDHPDPDQELPIFNPERTFQMGTGTSFNIDSNAMGLLNEYCKAANVALPETDEPKPQGWLSPAVWLIDKAHDILPQKAAATLSRPLLLQAAVWSDSQGLRDGLQNQVVNMINGVRDAHQSATNLGQEPVVIVAHSLGTAVAYRLLMNERLTEGAQVPLFITLGCPLTVKFIRRSMDQAELFCPDFIGRWINLYDSDDFVPLGSPLKEKEMGFDTFENYEGVTQEGDENAHSVAAHLRHPVVAKALHEVLSQA